MRDLNHMFNQMQGIMRDLQGAARLEQVRSCTWQPLVDIFERPDCIVITVELPGVRKDDIKVTVSEGVLHITGVRAKQIPENVEHVHLMEIPYGPFARFVRLPACTAVERIEADYVEGYLTIKVHRNS